MHSSLACEICGTMQGVGDHHLLHRSLGGGDEPHNLLATCAACHFQLHKEKVGGDGWSVQRTETRLAVIDNATGELIVERHFDPRFDQGLYITYLDKIEEMIGVLTDQAKYLDEEGIKAAAAAARKLNGRAWILEAELIYHAMLRVPRGQRMEKLREVAEELGHTEDYARGLLEIRQGIPLISERHEILPKSFYREALRAENPEEAIELALERKAEDERYSVRKFRHEINGLAPAPLEWCVCSCGDRHVRR